MRDEARIEFMIDCICDELIQNDVHQNKENYVKGLIDGLTWVLEEISSLEIRQNIHKEVK